MTPTRFHPTTDEDYVKPGAVWVSKFAPGTYMINERDHHGRRRQVGGLHHDLHEAETFLVDYVDGAVPDEAAVASMRGASVNVVKPGGD